MTPVADVTVEQLSADVHPLLHQLRAESPVAWIPAIERWLVTERELVLEALLDVTTYTVDDPRFTTAQVVGPSMLSTDGAAHARHRSPFALPFRRNASVDGFAGFTRHTATELVDALLLAGANGEPVDLRSGLAAPLAAETITNALGLVDTSTDDLLAWYGEIVVAVEAVTAGNTPDVGVAVAFEALDIAVRRSLDEPTSVIAGIAARSNLTTAELVSNTAVMLFGAIETSEGMTSNALVHVLDTPEVMAQLRERPELVDQAVEESLRLEPAATLVDRYVTKTTRLGDVELPEGAAVSLSLAGANRDPAFFADPDRFDLRRSNVGHHLAFVHGPHACIGMHLARLETAAALKAILAVLGDVKLVEPAMAQPTGLVFRKPESVLVTFSNA
jgi:cytochrome P450